MSVNDVICGYLDVKISSRSRRGLTPWKAWQKQWCEIKRIDKIEDGVELKLKSSSEGSTLSCVNIPRSATICRTESRTKQYAFGVFAVGKSHKPLLFLSGASESDSQEWMSSIRRMLSIASYLSVGESNFRVSLVDNVHSRAAGIVGLFGVLGTNAQEIFVRDPCTGDQKICWKWYQFHQFHLQAPAHPLDEKMVIVMHTSGDFPAGPGQIYLHCKDGPRLLQHLVARGKRPKTCSDLIPIKRLSRSEGDLCNVSSNKNTPDSPICFRSQTGSDDSGVRVSITSDDSGYALKPKTASSLVSIGITALTKTPGGSENNDDSTQDLSNLVEDSTNKGSLPRRESGVSLASGIYEEIPDDHESSLPKKYDHKNSVHIYENPIDMILNSNSKSSKPNPPPLPPPRNQDKCLESGDNLNKKAEVKTSQIFPLPFKHRCNTLPAKDLSRISQIFTSDSEYVVMSPIKTADKPKRTLTESLYMPMSPVINLKNKIESCYMSMNGKK